MEVRQGFNLLAAQAMKRAMRTDDPTFIERAAQAPEFWGFYDPEPIGAAVVCKNPDYPIHEIHIAVTRPGRIGFRFRRLVADALTRYPSLYAITDAGNHAVERLATGNGFVLLAEGDGRKMFGRLA